MRRIFTHLYVVILLVGLSQIVFLAPALAQRAIEGAAPHPMVPLPPDGYITLDEFRDFVIVTWPAGPHTRATGFESTVTLEGAHRQLEYTIDGHEVTALRLYRSYLQHFERSGLEILFSGIGEELGDRSGFTLLSQADGIARQASSQRDSIAYILARDTDDMTYMAMSFYLRGPARRMMVNVLEREEMETFDLFTQPAVESVVEEPISDSSQMTEDAVPLEAQNTEELESGLIADGRVVVNAILFAFDSADILPQSSEALATVAELMRERPSLKLLVVGHTDGVGSFDYNLRLSVERASAVVSYLTHRHAISPARLRPAGAGPMSPITTNRTEEGRALNRRVELVEVID